MAVRQSDRQTVRQTRRPFSAGNPVGRVNVLATENEADIESKQWN